MLTGILFLLSIKGNNYVEKILSIKEISTSIKGQAMKKNIVRSS